MIDSAGNNDEIVRAIINLARTLGLKVVAEGIETKVQLELLKELNCEGGQGFLLAKPMDFSSLCEFLGKDIQPMLLPIGFEDIPTASMIQ